MSLSKPTCAAALAGALVGAALAAAGSANAHAWKTPYADNSNHTYCHSSLNTTVKDASHDAFQDSLAYPTDMTVSFLGECNSTDDEKTDVWVFKGNYGSDWRGQYQCWQTLSGSRCETANVKINTNVITSLSQTRKTMCHEVGHSVGLVHYDSAPSGNPGPSCMISGTSTVSTYSAHEKSGHINARY